MRLLNWRVTMKADFLDWAENTMDKIHSPSTETWRKYPVTLARRITWKTRTKVWKSISITKQHTLTRLTLLKTKKRFKKLRRWFKSTLSFKSRQQTTSHHFLYEFLSHSLSQTSATRSLPRGTNNKKKRRWHSEDNKSYSFFPTW